MIFCWSLVTAELRKVVQVDVVVNIYMGGSPFSYIVFDGFGKDYSFGEGKTP